jgi:hypothetical protein
MRYLMALLVPFVILIVYNAQADSDGVQLSGNGTQAEGNYRYDLRETEQGLVRLDRRTGLVSLCESTGSTMTCKTVADDRVAYEDEIQRLDEEVQALRNRLARLDPDGDKALLEHDGERYVFTMELPNQDDVQEGLDAVGEFTDDVMNGFQSMMKSLKDKWGNNNG